MLESDLLEEKFLQNLEQSIKNLRLVDLELFTTAAKSESLGKAARAHHLSQSAASAAVLRVEAALGVMLCTHERKRFRLNNEGKILLPKIEGVIRQVREILTSKEELPIRLVTTHAIAKVAVPALLPISNIHFQHKRPDEAYAAILSGDADLALVLDNAPWKGVAAPEVGRGFFQLYSKEKGASLQPVLLPEEQMEVLFLQQSFLEVHGYPLPIKSRIPSWSLIAEICRESSEVGFLPDFLARKLGLFSVLWQPAPSSYRILAIYQAAKVQKIQDRIDHLLKRLIDVFSN